MSERLRRALHDAGLDADDVARSAGVDQRTVQRWIAGRTPRPRYRRELARLLKRDEAHLWPYLAEHDPAMLSASAEVHEAYACRADLPADAWWRLFTQATRRIDLLGYALLHLTENHPRLPDLLAGKAAGGCEIRIALADPGCSRVAERDAEEGLDGGLTARIRTSIIYLEPLDERDGIELRLHQTPMYNSIARLDEQMLVTPHLFTRPGKLAPLLHLRRRKDGGIFDNFATHFDDVWESAAPLAQGAAR